MPDARVLHRALFVSLLAGLAFSIYAGFEVYSIQLTKACSINPFFSCGSVLGSGHTTFPPGSGIEDWYWGVGGYVAMIAIDIPLLRTYDRRLLYGLFGLSVAGLSLAVVFGYIELAIIHALCPICLGAYIGDIGVVVCAALLVRMRLAADREAARDAAEPAAA